MCTSIMFVAINIRIQKVYLLADVQMAMIMEFVANYASRMCNLPLNLCLRKSNLWVLRVKYIDKFNGIAVHYRERDAVV